MRCTPICLVQRCSLRFSRQILLWSEGGIGPTSSLSLSACSNSQCIHIVHCGFAVSCRDPWLWCVVVHIWNFRRSHRRPPRFTLLLLSHADKFITPHQRRLLPAERHLSALSSLSLHFPFPLSLLSFPPHVVILMSKLIASHLLYRIPETFCTV